MLLKGTQNLHWNADGQFLPIRHLRRCGYDVEKGLLVIVSKSGIETEPGEMHIVFCWCSMILLHTRCATPDSVKEQLIDIIRVHILCKRPEMRVSGDVGAGTVQCLSILRDFIGKQDKA